MLPSLLLRYLLSIANTERVELNLSLEALIFVIKLIIIAMDANRGIPTLNKNFGRPLEAGSVSSLETYEKQLAYMMPPKTLMGFASQHIPR